jgi:hypothetical protein
VSSPSVAQDGQTRPRGRVLLTQLAQPLRAFMATEAGSAGLLLTVTVMAQSYARATLRRRREREGASRRGFVDRIMAMVLMPLEIEGGKG